MAAADTNISFGSYNSGFQVAHNSGIINLNSTARQETLETPPSPLSTVPFPPDQDYIPRGALFDEIDKKLSAPAHRVALVGLGGVGKSQLAIQYAHQIRDASPSTWVLWIHASSAARFDSSVRDTLDQLKVPGRSDPTANVCYLLRSWLRDRGGKWLIILDNADHVGFLLEPPTVIGQPDSTSVAGQHQERRLDYLPSGNHGSMLVTSRSREAALKIVEWHSIVEVEPMDEEHAVALVEQKLGARYDREDIVRLATALDFIPLAMAQAAAYIRGRAPRCSVGQYIEKFEKSDKSRYSILDRDEGDLRRDREASNSIITTWQISFEHIRETRRSAADLLSLMSIFDRQAIPEALLQDRSIILIVAEDSNSENNDSSDSDQDSSNNDVDDPSDTGAEEFQEDLTMLQSYSFISITTEDTIYKMHRLVQLATQRWLSANGQLERWKCQFVENLDIAFPAGRFENWRICRPLFPHALTALQLKLASQYAMLRQASVMNSSALYASEIGAYSDAESMAVMSVKILKKVLGDGHPSTLRSIATLGSTYWNQGRYKEAEKLHLEVLETRKKVLGEEHPNTLISMGDLASIYSSQGRYEEAEKLEVEVLDTRKKVLGVGHPNTLASIGNLASMYRDQGRYEEAEKLEVEVVETRKKVLGVGHPDTLVSIGNLATTYWNQGRYEDAEELQVEELETSKKVLGEGHPNTLTSMYKLATTLRMLDRRQSSVNLMSLCAELSSTSLGPSHPDVLDRCRWTVGFEMEQEDSETEEGESKTEKKKSETEEEDRK